MNSKRNTFWKRFSWIGLIMISFAITGSALARTQSGDAQARLNENMKKWSSSGTADYKYIFQRICYCPQEYVRPVRISVKDGAIEEVAYKDTGQKIAKAEFERYLTIDQLFETIQDAINKKAHKISVSYDRKSGYPRSLSIDYDERMIDEEMVFRIEDLVTGK